MGRGLRALRVGWFDPPFGIVIVIDRNKGDGDGDGCEYCDDNDSLPVDLSGLWSPCVEADGGANQAETLNNLPV